MRSASYPKVKLSICEKFHPLFPELFWCMSRESGKPFRESGMRKDGEPKRGKREKDRDALQRSRRGSPDCLRLLGRSVCKTGRSQFISAFHGIAERN